MIISVTGTFPEPKVLAEFEKSTSDFITPSHLVWYAKLHRREPSVDSKHNEYSQILQSSNSWYELFNEGRPDINGACVDLKIQVPNGLKMFNNMFTELLKERCTEREIRLIKFFEISQFTRMLPFKMAIDKPKMFFFYALASKLFQETQ